MSAESRGREDTSARGEFVFRGGKLLLKEGTGDHVMEGTVVLNPGARPKTIDMQMLAAGFQNMLQASLYGPAAEIRRPESRATRLPGSMACSSRVSWIPTASAS